VSSAGAFVEEALRWLSDPSSGTSVSEASASTQKGTSSVAGEGKPKPRILFVDDNADMRNYISALLAERYELTTAADGLTALAKLRQQPADLVLSDIMMPGPDGFELLRAIRSDPATRTTPVILLTAQAGEESTVEGLEQGADDYLTKPFNARELTARVAATLALARLRKESLEREQLSKSEAQLRQIVDAIPQMIAVLNPDGTLVYANHTSIEYTGLTIEELTRGDFSDRAVHPEDVARLRSERREALSRGERFENEQRVLSKNGQYRWFLMQYNPVMGEDGRVIRWYATATNIDDRKRSEERLRQENVALREEIDKASMFEEIVGTSPALQTVLSRVSKVSATDSTVLITGETGTGKELVARAIHRRSLRSSYPFVSVNCAAIPRDLIASELFGHEKGSFTGATQRRLGRFELAQRGTIFLDEVGELPAQTQIALLRVLQEHEFERVGGAGSIRTDVRVIAATNRDLEAAIAAGLFRSDLFYRLNVFPIEIPPLRERREDIPMLVEYFIDRYARKAGKNFKTVNKESLDLLQSYSWPGNIRELQNVIERSVIVSSGDIFSVDEAWLSKESSQPPSQVQVIRPLQGESRGERKIIEAALAESRGRIAGPSGAAAKLQIPASTLEYKIKTLKISKNQFKFRSRKLSK
jgi:PAS domain S-box-containing protein